MGKSKFIQAMRDWFPPGIFYKHPDIPIDLKMLTDWRHMRRKKYNRNKIYE